MARSRGTPLSAWASSGPHVIPVRCHGITRARGNFTPQLLSPPLSSPKPLPGRQTSKPPLLYSHLQKQNVEVVGIKGFGKQKGVYHTHFCKFYSKSFDLILQIFCPKSEISSLKRAQGTGRPCTYVKLTQCKMREWLVLMRPGVIMSATTKVNTVWFL